jgi:hypothetical protein
MGAKRHIQAKNPEAFELCRNFAQELDRLEPDPDLQARLLYYVMGYLTVMGLRRDRGYELLEPINSRISEMLVEQVKLLKTNMQDLIKSLRAGEKRG